MARALERRSSDERTCRPDDRTWSATASRPWLSGMNTRFPSLVTTVMGLVGCVSDASQPPVPDASASDAQADAAVDRADVGVPMEAAACGAPNEACCSGTCTGGAQCASGTCTCPSQTVACGASCVDLQSDPANCGSCNHDCSGGACTAGACQPNQIATGQGTVTGVALDSTSIYWSRANPATGAIFRADRDGKNPVPLYDYGANFEVDVIGATNGYVYFRRSTSSFAGFFRCKLPDCASGPLVVADNLVRPKGGAIDVAGSRLYWARGTDYNNAPDGTILSAPLDGSQAPTQAITSSTEPNPTQVGIVGNAVYWLDSGSYVSNAFQDDGAIRKAPLGQGQTPTTVAAIPTYWSLGAFSVDAKNAYVGGSNGWMAYDLLAVSTLGGVASPLVTKIGGALASFADGSGVYWAQLGGKLQMCAATGCSQTPTTIEDNANANALTADSKALAWGTYNGFVYVLAR